MAPSEVAWGGAVTLGTEAIGCGGGAAGSVSTLGAETVGFSTAMAIMLATSWQRAWSWLSPSAGNGVAGDGCNSAWGGLGRWLRHGQRRPMMFLASQNEKEKIQLCQQYVQRLSWWRRHGSSNSAWRLGQCNSRPSMQWCADQVQRFCGVSWIRTFVPGGASGVLLKSKVPLSCALAESFGLMHKCTRDGGDSTWWWLACSMS
jgi:hypothetical protein